MSSLVGYAGTKNSILQVKDTQVIVSSKGLANGSSTLFNDGAKFGIDTPGTTTSGIQEAIDYVQGKSITINGGTVTGGIIYLTEGDFLCSSQILIDNSAPNSITIKGSGKTSTFIEYTNTAAQDFIVTTTVTGGGGNNYLNLFCYDLSLVYDESTNLNNIVNLYGLNEGIFQECAFVSKDIFGSGSNGTIGTNVYDMQSAAVTRLLGICGFKTNNNGNNYIIFSACTFYGLANGIVNFSDHVKIENCEFGVIGSYYNGTSQAYGTLWTSSVLNLNYGSCYIDVSGFPAYLHNNHYFASNVAIFGGAAVSTSDWFESTNWWIVNGATNGMFLQFPNVLSLTSQNPPFGTESGGGAIGAVAGYSIMSPVSIRNRQYYQNLTAYTTTALTGQPVVGLQITPKGSGALVWDIVLRVSNNTLGDGVQISVTTPIGTETQTYTQEGLASNEHTMHIHGETGNAFLTPLWLTSQTIEIYAQAVTGGTASVKVISFELYEL